MLVRFFISSTKSKASITNIEYSNSAISEDILLLASTFDFFDASFFLIDFVKSL
jgi:hypothetical protein